MQSVGAPCASQLASAVGGPAITKINIKSSPKEKDPSTKDSCLIS